MPLFGQIYWHIRFFYVRRVTAMATPMKYSWMRKWRKFSREQCAIRPNSMCRRSRELQRLREQQRHSNIMTRMLMVSFRSWLIGAPRSIKPFPRSEAGHCDAQLSEHLSLNQSFAHFQAGAQQKMPANADNQLSLGSVSDDIIWGRGTKWILCRTFLFCFQCQTSISFLWLSLFMNSVAHKFTDKNVLPCHGIECTYIIEWTEAAKCILKLKIGH